MKLLQVVFSYHQQFFHVVPLYVCITPVLASVAVQSVQYRVKAVAGLLIASRCACVIRGGKTPCVVLIISSAALAAVGVPNGVAAAHVEPFHLST